jgi:protein CpxP
MKQIRQAILFAVCMLAVAAWSQPGQPAQGDDHQQVGQGHGQGMGQGHGAMNADQHLQMLSQKLNLTDDQKAKIKPILEEHLQDRDAIMKDQSLSMEQKHEKMKTSMDAARTKIDPILNDEQKKQFAQMVQDMHNQGKGMHSHKGAHQHGQSKDDSSPK